MSTNCILCLSISNLVAAKFKGPYNQAMTQLLEQAISKVKELSAAEQDAMAAVILAELEHASGTSR